MEASRVLDILGEESFREAYGSNSGVAVYIEEAVQDRLGLCHTMI